MADADQVIGGSQPGAGTGTALAAVRTSTAMDTAEWPSARPKARRRIHKTGVVHVASFGSAWMDEDGDGLLARAVGGSDCDDNNADIFPHGTEDTGPDSDGYATDGDCDGWIDGLYQNSLPAELF